MLNCRKYGGQRNILSCTKSVVLVIYCCITNYPKTQWLKTTIHTYYTHSFPGSGTQECFSRVVLAQGHTGGHSQDVSWGGSHLKAWLGLEYLLPRWVIHMFGKLILAVGGRPQLLLTWASPRLSECPRDVVAYFLLSNLREKNRSSTMSFMIKPQKPHTITLAVFCWSHRSTLIPRWMGLYKRMNERKCRSLAPILRYRVKAS